MQSQGTVADGPALHATSCRRGDGEGNAGERTRILTNLKAFFYTWQDWQDLEWQAPFPAGLVIEPKGNIDTWQ